MRKFAFMREKFRSAAFLWRRRSPCMRDSHDVILRGRVLASSYSRLRARRLYDFARTSNLTQRRGSELAQDRASIYSKATRPRRKIDRLVPQTSIVRGLLCLHSSDIVQATIWATACGTQGSGRCIALPGRPWRVSHLRYSLCPHALAGGPTMPVCSTSVSFESRSSSFRGWKA